MTDQEKKEIIQELKAALYAESTDVSALPAATTAAPQGIAALQGGKLVKMQPDTKRGLRYFDGKLAVYAGDFNGLEFIEGELAVKCDQSSVWLVNYGSLRGRLAVMDGGITSEKIANAAVTTSKIEEGAVVGTKLATNSVTEEKLYPAAVTSAKIKDAAVTEAKLAADIRTRLLSPLQQKWLAEKVAADYASRITVQASVSPGGVQDRREATDYTVTIKTMLDGKLTDAARLTNQSQSEGAGLGITIGRTATGTYQAKATAKAGRAPARLTFEADMSGVKKTVQADLQRLFPILTLVAPTDTIAPTDSSWTNLSAATVAQPVKASAAGKYDFAGTAGQYLYMIVPEGVTGVSRAERVEYGETLAVTNVGTWTAAWCRNTIAHTGYDGQFKATVYRLGGRRGTADNDTTDVTVY